MNAFLVAVLVIGVLSFFVYALASSHKETEGSPAEGPIQREPGPSPVPPEGDPRPPTGAPNDRSIEDVLNEAPYGSYLLKEGIGTIGDLRQLATLDQVEGIGRVTGLEVREALKGAEKVPTGAIPPVTTRD